VILVVNEAWARVKEMVATPEKSCPSRTLHDDPEQTSDVTDVGPKTPGQADQKAWVPEIAKRIVNTTNLNILEVALVHRISQTEIKR